MSLDIRGNEALAQLTRLRVMAQVAAKLGWQPVNELLRLEGFEEPWECAMHKGVELPSDSTLAACGITGDAMIVTVRKVLVAEGANKDAKDKVSLTHTTHTHAPTQLSRRSEERRDS